MKIRRIRPILSGHGLLGAAPGVKFSADRSLLTPLGLHFTFWYVMSEIDASMPMLAGALMAVLFSSLLAGAAMTPGRAVLSALWVPAAATAVDLYWLLDSRAPYGPAKEFLGAGGWDPTGGRAPFVLLCAVVASAGIAVPVFSRPARKALNRFSWSDLSDE